MLLNISNKKNTDMKLFTQYTGALCKLKHELKRTVMSFGL